MHGFLHDLRIALRHLRTSPSFSLMVIGMLALGIAGNAAIFSIFNSMFLRPLPFADSDRLVDLDETAPRWSLTYAGVSGPDFEHWQKGSSTFASMAFFRTPSYNLSDRGVARRVRGALVTHDMLDVFGLKPAIGRNFSSQDEQAYTVVGVLPREAVFPDRVDLWLPLAEKFGVNAREPLIYAGVALGVLGVGLIATWCPPAAPPLVDPMRELRFE